MELAKQETDPFWRTYALALAYFAHGDRAEADAALKKLIDEYTADGGSQIASVYALRKEPDKMFEWLDHAWAMHDAGVTEMLEDPFLRALQGRPALHRLRAKDRCHAETRRQTMIADPGAPNESKFEIGHVLFLDIVGYSKLLIEEQKERLDQLTEIVLGTPQVRDSSDEQLVRLPTGDGMALVFHHSAEEPAAVRARDRGGAAQTSGNSGADGDSQRAGQRRDRCERAEQHRRRRD